MPNTATSYKKLPSNIVQQTIRTIFGYCDKVYNSNKWVHQFTGVTMLLLCLLEKSNNILPNNLQGYCNLV